MATIIASFEEILRSKQIPLAKSVDENGQTTYYKGNFQLTAERIIPFSIAFQATEGITDVQILYSNLAQAADFHKKAAVLEAINELNEAESGYYHLCLSGDGELYLRLLTRTSNEVLPLYEMLITGSDIAKRILPKLEGIIK